MAAQMERVNSMQEELTCPICLELYDSPVQLPCLHNYCLECLKQKVILISSCEQQNNNRLECPQCRHHVCLQNSSVESLPKNFSLESIVTKFKRQQQVATSSRIGIEKTDVAVTSNEEEIRKLKVLDCVIHKKEIGLYCMLCYVPMCVSCFSDHKTHQVEELEMARAYLMDHTENHLVPAVKKHEQELLEKKCIAEHQLQKIKETGVHTESKIIALCKDMKNLIDCKEKEVMDQLRQNKKAQVVKWQSHLDHYNFHLASISSDLGSLSHDITKQDSTTAIQHLDTFVHRSRTTISRILEDLKENKDDNNECYIVTADRNLGDVNRLLTSMKSLFLSEHQRQQNTAKLEEASQSTESAKVVCSTVSIESFKSGPTESTKSTKPTTSTEATASTKSTKPTELTKPAKLKESTKLTTLKSETRSTLLSEKSLKSDKPIKYKIVQKSKVVPELSKQRVEILDLMDKPMVKGELRYLVSLEWFSKWNDYVSQNIKRCPGSIDNSDLIMSDGNLQPNLVVDYDYHALCEEAWDLLCSWYGLQSQNMIIERKVIQLGFFKKVLEVETYKIILNLCQSFDSKESIDIQVSRSDTIATIKNHFSQLFGMIDGKCMELYHLTSSGWKSLELFHDNCELSGISLPNSSKLCCKVIDE